MTSRGIFSARPRRRLDPVQATAPPKMEGAAMTHENETHTFTVPPTELAVEDFGRLLAAVDTRRRRHREVLRRILARVAAADGPISANARKVFSIFADVPEDQIEAYAAAAPPSARQMARVDPAQRERMVACALAVALCDGRFEPERRDLAASYARSLGVGDGRFDTLSQLGCLWFLHQEMQHLYAYGHPDETEYAAFLETVERLGVPFAVVETLQTAFLSHRGWLDRRAAVDWHRADHATHPDLSSPGAAGWTPPHRVWG